MLPWETLAVLWSVGCCLLCRLHPPPVRASVPTVVGTLVTHRKAGGFASYFYNRTLFYHLDPVDMRHLILSNQTIGSIPFEQGSTSPRSVSMIPSAVFSLRVTSAFGNSQHAGLASTCKIVSGSGELNPVFWTDLFYSNQWYLLIVRKIAWIN